MTGLDAESVPASWYLKTYWATLFPWGCVNAKLPSALNATVAPVLVYVPVDSLQTGVQTTPVGEVQGSISVAVPTVTPVPATSLALTPTAALTVVGLARVSMP